MPFTSPPTTFPAPAPPLLRYDGNPQTVDSFLSGLACSAFTYSDVLHCYSALVGAAWPIPPDGPPDSDSIDLPEDGVGHISRDIEVLIAGGRQPAAAVCGRRRAPIRWDSSEVDALVRGIAEFGVGRWVRIRSEYAEEFSRNERTARDLCSCYWALKRKGICE